MTWSVQTSSWWTRRKSEKFERAKAMEISLKDIKVFHLQVTKELKDHSIAPDMLPRKSLITRLLCCPSQGWLPVQCLGHQDKSSRWATNAFVNSVDHAADQCLLDRILRFHAEQAKLVPTEHTFKAMCRCVQGIAEKSESCWSWLKAKQPAYPTSGPGQCLWSVFEYSSVNESHWLKSHSNACRSQFAKNHLRVFLEYSNSPTTTSGTCLVTSQAWWPDAAGQRHTRAAWQITHI